MKKFFLCAVAALALTSTADAAVLERQPAVAVQSDFQQSVVELDMWSHLKHKIFGGKRKDDDDKHHRKHQPPHHNDRHRYDSHHGSHHDRNGHPMPPPPPPPPRR